MNRDFDCDVLVVGLGPVGDAMAALAAVQGLSVIAIDRSPELFPLPRAAVFDHEIMRIFQMIGVADRVGPLCRVPERYQFRTANNEVLLDFPVAPIGAYGWAENYALHQPAVERELRGRLAELDVPVRLGVTFDGMTQDETGVTVSLATPQGSETVRTRYLVGCDGSWSPVREALGIRLDDYHFDEPWLVLDTIIKEHDDLPIANMQICDPARPVTYMTMSGERFRWEFMLKPGEQPDEMLKEDSIRALLADWIDVDRVQIERKAVYRFHALVANRWRDGRVLIAGDAAHQMPPFAGQGMCSGIRDAANLAWKIADVVNGRAGDALLDTYQVEREPHVRAIIETAIAMGKVVCILDPAAAAARDRDMLARKATGAQDVSVVYPDLVGGMLTDLPGAGALFPQPVSVKGERFDGLLGTGPALVGRGLPAETTGDVRFVDIDAPEVALFGRPIDVWLARHGADAVLVRPDRHVFGTGEASRLLKLWRAMLKVDVLA